MAVQSLCATHQKLRLVGTLYPRDQKSGTFCVTRTTPASKHGFGSYRGQIRSFLFDLTLTDDDDVLLIDRVNRNHGPHSQNARVTSSWRGRVSGAETLSQDLVQSL